MYYLCMEFGLPFTKAHEQAGGWYFTPCWAFGLLNAFTIAGYPPDNMKHRPNGTDNVAAMKRLVKKIIRESAYDLIEVHAAFALGGPRAVLDLAAQDAEHEQTLPEN